MKYNTFGRNLRYQLALRNMTQRELCNKVHIEEAALSRYMSGTREPKISVVQNIAKALDISIESLLGG